MWWRWGKSGRSKSPAPCLCSHCSPSDLIRSNLVWQPASYLYPVRLGRNHSRGACRGDNCPDTVRIHVTFRRHAAIRRDEKFSLSSTDDCLLLLTGLEFNGKYPGSEKCKVFCSHYNYCLSVRFQLSFPWITEFLGAGRLLETLTASICQWEFSKLFSCISLEFFTTETEKNEPKWPHPSNLLIPFW